MSLYFFIYFTAVVLGFCFSSAKDKNVIFLLKVLLFSVLFLPLAFRYNIGTDYSNYVRIVNRGIFTGNYDVFEVGWIPLIFIIDKLNLDIQFFFIVPAFLSILILFNVIPRKYFFFCVPVFLSFEYLEMFSLVRQSFAGMIFLLGVKNFLKKENLKALFWGLIAACFHKSLLLPLLLLPLCSLRLKFFSRITNFILFIILLVALNVFDISKMAFAILGNTSYGYYANSIFNRTTEIGSGLGILAKFILFFLILVFSTRYYKKDRFYNLICVSAFSLQIGLILASHIHIFNRVGNIFTFSYLLFAIGIFNSKSRFRKFVLFIIILILFACFAKTATSAFSLLGGGLGIVPYKSIFER